MSRSRVDPVAALFLLLSAAVLDAEVPDRRTKAPTVVFVCEHGNVKSLIAREWFNRRAKERGVAARAVSRGLAPGTSVPAPIAEALRRDGFDVRGFEPGAPTSRELRKAARVIAIGLPPGALGSAPSLQAWDGIPAASESYTASRDALRARIEDLLEALADHR